MHRKQLVACLSASVFVIGLSHAAWGQLASRPAEEWAKTLEQPTRVSGLRVDDVIARLGLKPGDTVADLGAGTGLFEVGLAKAVSARGKVYAVDIDEGFFPTIKEKAAAAGVTNVQTVLGKFTDPNLPAKDIDLALFHDVLHHVQDREGYLKALAPYVNASGRIAVVDYDTGQGPHKDQPELLVPKAQVTAWMNANGFKVVEEVPLFSDKYFVIYGRK